MRTRCILETAFCVFLAGLLFWKGVLPGWQSLNTDFPNYYLVARLFHEGYLLDRIYDWIWLQRIKDHWGLTQPLVGFAGLTPFSALPIVPLAAFSALHAKRIWIVGNLLMLAAAVEGLHKVTELGRRRVWLLCLLCVFPLRTNFLLGQMHLLVLDLLIFAYVANRKQKHTACGICLSTAAMLKIYPIALAAYFAWKRQWAALLATCCATVILVAGCTMALGPTIVYTYFTEVLPRSLVGEVLDPYAAQAASMAALFHKLFIYEPQLNPFPRFASPNLYSALYPVWQAAILLPLLALLAPKEPAPDGEQLEWAAWVFALLLLSPVPSSYHFVVMVLPVVLLMDFLRKRREIKLALLALALYCMLSLVEFLPRRITSSGIALAFSRLWVEIAFWLLLLACLWRCREEKNLSVPLQNALTGAAALLILTVGALGYHRHFAQLELDTQRRMRNVPLSYLASGVRKTAGGYLFTAMQEQNYQVIDQTGRPIGKQGVDALSVGANETASKVLLEVADASGSRSVALLPNGQRSAQADLWNAESPVPSSDGRTAVFVRETRGRGSLWMGPAGTGSPAAVTQLTPPAYDVRNFDFASSGRIVFAAKFAGRLTLFQMTSIDAPSELLPDLVDTDYPAISPDQRRVAFTRRVHHRWQLEYLDRESGRRQMLTSGDCNAYSSTWDDNDRLIYATDCGRGLGLTALASVAIGRTSPSR